MFLQIETVFIEREQDHGWPDGTCIKLCRCCNSVNMRSYSKFMTDRKHIKRRKMKS